jgi:hypothetical protein
MLLFLSVFEEVGIEKSKQFAQCDEGDTGQS